MYGKAASIYYGLSSFLLLTGLFVLSPNQTPEVSKLQADVTKQFSIAWQQTIGDQPYFDELFAFIEGVDAFYAAATESTIALLEDKSGSDQDLVYVFTQVYDSFTQSFKPEAKTVAIVEPQIDLANFMKEEPLRNIVPMGEVAGVSEIFNTPSSQAVNIERPWVTIKDNYTDQLYCLAIYNGEVNKYLGECKYDYY